MKKLLVLTLITTLGAIPAWSQATVGGASDTPDPTNTPGDNATETTPGTPTGTTTATPAGTTTGTGTGTATGTTAPKIGTTPATAPGGGELRDKLQAMTPEQREEFLRHHPEIRDRLQAAAFKKYEAMTPAQRQEFAQKHPELAKRLANASEAGTTTKDPGHPRVNEVNQRENNEQKSIANGVRNGSLTAQQASHLEKGEQRIQSQEARDLAKNNGHLTKAEQRQLNREENRLTHRIQKDEHTTRKEERTPHKTPKEKQS